MRSTLVMGVLALTAISVTAFAEPTRTEVVRPSSSPQDDTKANSDAVPDAFVDSDLGLGGTNVRGITAGLLYGLARDTQLGLRYLSGRTISSPTVQPGLKDKYAVDSLQVDLNVRF